MLGGPQGRENAEHGENKTRAFQPTASR
jgi:hypothetical protein